MNAALPRRDLPRATVRFAGDFGDGIHMMGEHFTRTATAVGNAVFTVPDLPAEIRSKPGTLGGVHGYQVHFGNSAITPGDLVDVLVAMNPAALRANLPDVAPKGLIVVNSEMFVPAEWVKAGYDRDPLSDGTLSGFTIIRVPVNSMNREAVAGLRQSPRDADRSRGFFVLGLLFWLYDRPLEPTFHWLNDRFAALPDVHKADRRALKAGYRFGETLSVPGFRVSARVYALGTYRRVSGSTAMSLGLAAAAARCGRELFFSAFPFAPAVDLLHHLMEMRPPGVCPVQAEDESAAAAMALGASFGGAVGVTATAGPGLGSMSDILGLAVAAELPLVVLHVQRCGPALGVPGKPEQADLLQAIHGRNGESPVPILAIRSPADGFDVVLEATRLATRYMTPVIVLTDVYLMNAAEPWRVPDMTSLPDLQPPTSPKTPAAGKPFFAYSRDVRLARPWALPGTPGLEHRIGGLEKEDGTGNVSYEAADHEHMVHVRGQKIAQIAGEIPRLTADGPANGDMLLISWGGTYGAVRIAAERLRADGMSVAHAHLRHLFPMPSNTGDVLRRYRRVVAPELNCGQLQSMLRSQYLVEVEAMTKVQGRPLTSAEAVAWVKESEKPRVLSQGIEL